MKTYIPYSLLAAVAATGMAMGAETAYTTPVGYVSIGDTTTGQPAVKATTDVAISIPIGRATEFAGAVASTTSTTITVSGTPAWTANQWAPAGGATPYLVTVKSGAQAGLIGLVTANTADTLTVTVQTGGTLTALAATDTITISKAWTLITAFPAGTFPNGTRVLGYTGTTSGQNIAPNLNYVYSAGNFLAGATNSNNVILYPGESFLIRAGANAVAGPIVLSGEVPIAPSRTFIDKLTAGVAQDSRISYYGAGEEVIGDSGLSALGLASGDRLLAFNNNASGQNKAPNETIVWNGTNWLQGATVVTTTYTLKAGRGYVFRRSASAPVGSLDWKDSQSYLSSL